MKPHAGSTTPKHFRWGFPSAMGAILFLVVCGQAVGNLMGAWPPWRALLSALNLDYSASAPPAGGWLAAMGGRDWLFAAFLCSSIGFVAVQRAALGRFFRSMHVGASLVILCTVAVAIGVLVPQIEGFEDREQRVTEANYESQFRSFAWAEGYFIYHLMHLYGIGMPEAEIPEQALAGLERYGRRYGLEEKENRRKLMEASFSGGKKVREIEAFIARHDRGLRAAFDVCTRLDFNRAYKSHWFASLLGLLFAAVAVNTLRYGPAKLFTLQKIGFFVTHLGILTLLAGGLVSNLATDRGLLNLYLGDPEPEDTYWRYHDPSKLGRMPFGLLLERFARRDWKQIQVEFPQERFSTAPPSYTLWEGRAIELDLTADEQGRLRPRLRVEVRELCDEVLVEPPSIREAYDPERPAEVFPVVELEALDMSVQEGKQRRIQLSPMARQRVYYDPDLSYRLKVAFADQAEEPQELFPAEEGTLGTIEFSVTGHGEGAPVSEVLRLDGIYDLPGGYRATVVRATCNFRLDPQTSTEIRDPRPLAQQPPLKPALWLRIDPPDGGPPAERFLLDGIDWREQGMQDHFRYSEVWMRFHWDPWLAPGPPRYALRWGTQSEPVLLDPDGVSMPAEIGAALPLPGSEPLVPRQFVLNADFEKNIVFREPERGPDGFFAGFYSDQPTGVELLVIEDPGTAGERRETVRLASERLYEGWRSPDGRCEIWYFENDKLLPYEWRSVLSVVERDEHGQPFVVPLGPEKKREIRVNDYFKYRGYRFFQTNADPKLPHYSGIGVVFDPGIPIVLTGMYTIIAGTVLAFLVRPIVRSRRERALSA